MYIFWLVAYVHYMVHFNGELALLECNCSVGDYKQSIFIHSIVEHLERLCILPWNK